MKSIWDHKLLRWWTQEKSKKNATVKIKSNLRLSMSIGEQQLKKRKLLTISKIQQKIRIPQTKILVKVC